MSQKEKPFNFQLLTANTHFDEGHVEKTCEYSLANHYANSVICSDQQIYEFIRWIQRQEFYENTTIVASGDHLVMGEYLYQEEKSLNERRVYNVFINPYVDYDFERLRNRTFTTLDMYPTTLASIGVRIEGNRLGLGTNLFSNKQTLPEQLGKDEVDNELSRPSNFYKNELLYVK